MSWYVEVVSYVRVSVLVACCGGVEAAAIVGPPVVRRQPQRSCEKYFQVRRRN
jgi:hypothetical protein